VLLSPPCRADHDGSNALNVQGERYVQSALEGERDREDPAGHLFCKPLPSGVSLLDIARRMDTPGCTQVRREFDEEATETAAEMAEPATAAETTTAANPADEQLSPAADELTPVTETAGPPQEMAQPPVDAEQEAAGAAAVDAAAAADESAAPASTIDAAAATEVQLAASTDSAPPPPAAAPDTVKAAAAAAVEEELVPVLDGPNLPDWPEDGWVPPCPGYMVCALCKGRSGPKGRWGPLHLGHPSHARYPLLVCAPCQERHGLGPPDETAKVGWAEGVVKLERRQGYWGGFVTQMVHPSLGDIGH
jgi:hypothetical protein